MNLYPSASIEILDPKTLNAPVFTDKDFAVIPNFIFTGSFDPVENRVEFFVYSEDNTLLYSDSNFNDWSNVLDPLLISQGISTLNIDPIKNVADVGITEGKVKVLYNFISDELGSSQDNPFFLKEISGDRTELRLQTNFTSDSTLQVLFDEFKTRISSEDYFDEFYLSFGENRYTIGTNILLENNNGLITLLVKLYEPLSPIYSLQDIVWITTKVGESSAYKIDFPIVPLVVDNLVYLKGPNISLDLNDQTSLTTPYRNYLTLLSSSLTSSYQHIQNLLQQNGVQLTPDYTDFSNFIFFSSAYRRISNFYTKVSQIESYTNDLAITNSITGSASQSFSVSASRATIQNQIDEIITNFDGYEKYLYFESSSYTYPKSNSTYPYTLYSTGSTQTLTWLGSYIETDTYYGGQLYSASIYDLENPNNLYQSIPEFLKNDPLNTPYFLFIEMMGQFFDNAWAYTDAISDKLKADNRINYGVSKDLVSTVLQSFGHKIYTNQFTANDLYTSLLGITPQGNLQLFPNTTSSLPIINSGIEYIKTYVTASLQSGSRIPLGEANERLYKRIYHNLPYLVKKKGTLEALKLIRNIYGIPSTILRFNEFGGRDAQSTKYDYFNDKFNYAFGTNKSASIIIPWNTLNREFGQIAPPCIQFRFKTAGIPSGSLSQSLFIKTSSPSSNSTDFKTKWDMGLFLFYTGSGLTSGSYSGSVVDPYNQYGTLRFYISGSSAGGGITTYKSSSDIYLPFFDGGWWNVMLQRNTVSDNPATTITYSLYAANKIYDENEGYTLGYIGSASFTNNEQRVNEAWSNSSSYVIADWTANFPPGIYLGGFISGSLGRGGDIITKPRNLFTGSFQEFRYYASPLSTSSFYDYVMNPQSINAYTTSGSVLVSGSSYRTLAFRADLGSELTTFPLVGTSDYNDSSNLFSIHPAKSGSFPTSSFSSSYLAQSFYKIQYFNTNIFAIVPSIFSSSFIKDNIETYYYAIPSTGTKTKTSDNIHIISSSYAQGNILSQYTSIEQKYPSSGSVVSNTNLFEAGFSPQEEINDDIIASMGRFDIGEYIGDPRLLSQSFTSYPDLDALAVYHFRKYNNSYNISDYVRLIKYIDNSLFKTIKDYIPAKTDASTGIIIKQHLLERNRHRMVLPTISQSYNQFTSSVNSLVVTNISGGNYYPYDSGSIYEFSGENGGVNNPSFPTSSLFLVISDAYPSQDTMAVSTAFGDTKVNFFGSDGFNYGPENLISPTYNINPITWDNTYKGLTTQYNGKIVFDLDRIAVILNGLGIIISSSLQQELQFFPGNNTTVNTFSNPFNCSIGETFTFWVSKSAAASPTIYLEYLGASSPSYYNNTFYGPTGVSYFSTPSQDSFYNGEYSGSNITVTTQSLFSPDFLNSPTGSINLTASSPSFITASDGTILANYQFENSNYYPLTNNINNNRLSTYYQDIDYSTNPFYPVNLNAVLNNLAPAQTPDSNYSSLRHIISKYSGSKLIAADYNKYFQRGATVTLRDGTISSSWQGDTSYGTSPVIESRPRFFAHFTYGYPSLEDFNTFTFNIDQLIDINNPNIVTSAGNLDSNYFASSVFPPSRRLLVILPTEGNKPNVPGSIETQVSTTYSPPFPFTVPSGSKTINRSGLDYDIIISNESTTQYSNKRISKITYFSRRNQRTPGTEANFDTLPVYLYGKPSSQPQGGTTTQQFTYSGSFLATGSGHFVIADSSYTASFIDFGGRYLFETNRPLAAIHHYNYLLANDLTSSNTTFQQQLTKLNPNINKNNPDNYYGFNSIASNLVQYGNNELPFLIQVNDIIRVSYASSGNPITKEFRVTSIDNYNNGIETMGWYDTIADSYSGPPSYKTSPYIKFNVDPDPSTLDFPIPHNSSSLVGDAWANSLQGVITIKRPRNDNRTINIKFTNPSGSNGIQTQIGEGYLIPEDMSPEQKQKAQALINNITTRNSLNDIPEAGTDQGLNR